MMAAERPTGPDGEPAEIDELMRIIAAVMESDVWKRARRASVRLVEVPFALRLSAVDYAAMGGQPAAEVEIIDGRIDLIFRDDSGWTVVDYKSDAAGSAIAPMLLDRYRRQVGLYAEAWQHMTGETVTERMLLFTADGVTLSA